MGGWLSATARLVGRDRKRGEGPPHWARTPSQPRRPAFSERRGVALLRALSHAAERRRPSAQRRYLPSEWKGNVHRGALSGGAASETCSTVLAECVGLLRRRERERERATGDAAAADHGHEKEGGGGGEEKQKKRKKRLGC